MSVFLFLNHTRTKDPQTYTLGIRVVISSLKIFLKILNPDPNQRSGRQRASSIWSRGNRRYPRNKHIKKSPNITTKPTLTFSSPRDREGLARTSAPHWTLVWIPQRSTATNAIVMSINRTVTVTAAVD